MHYYRMKKNQLASSSVKETLVSQKINLIQFPAQKCKHPIMYMHTWYVQTAELLRNSSVPFKDICRITVPGLGISSRNMRTDLSRSFGREE